MSDLASLHRAQAALAEEIKANPDRVWRRTLMERYTAFVRKVDPEATIEPVEMWHDGSIELTEAILRSVGHGHI